MFAADAELGSSTGWTMMNMASEEVEKLDADGPLVSTDVAAAAQTVPFQVKDHRARLEGPMLEAWQGVTNSIDFRLLPRFV